MIPFFLDFIFAVKSYLVHLIAEMLIQAEMNAASSVHFHQSSLLLSLVSLINKLGESFSSFFFPPITGPQENDASCS